MILRIGAVLAVTACVAWTRCAWAGDAAGCPGCHDVHGGMIARPCTTCHTVDLMQMLHPSGPGTPLENTFTDPAATCRICHAPDGLLHIWRVNTSAVYSAGSSGDWLDVDETCGQCHGGGTDPDQNPTSNSASYKTKTMLAFFAAGMHTGEPSVPPMIMFSYTTSGLTVNVNASDSSCSGSPANCNRYDWSWGDGTANGSGVVASHTYDTAGAKTITLTAEQEGVSGGTSTKTISVYAPDAPPAVAGTCTLNADTWSETVLDTSTDDDGLTQVTVSWGDGSMLSSDATAPFGPFTHTYLAPGTFTITHRAIDSAGQSRSRTCTASPTYFAISGAVFRSNGTTPVPSATVQVRGASGTRTVYTAVSGAFSVRNLKPGTYTLTVAKTGYTFSVPAAAVTLGPSSSGAVIVAVAP